MVPNGLSEEPTTGGQDKCPKRYRGAVEHNSMKGIKHVQGKEVKQRKGKERELDGGDGGGVVSWLLPCNRLQLWGSVAPAPARRQGCIKG